MFRSHFCLCILCSLIGLTLLLLLMFGAPPVLHAQAKGPVSFISDVMPILRENCYACHDPRMKKGKFSMATYETFRAGGTKGDPVVPGQAKESVLIKALTRTDKKRMPPPNTGEALPPEKIAVLGRWINEGAKADVDPKADLLKLLLARWQPPQPPASYKFPVVINALAFTPDGQKLVAGGFHELTVWDIGQARLLRRLFTRAERACGLAFLPDGKLAVAGDRPGQEGDLRIFDLEAGTTKEVDGVPTVDGVNDKAALVALLLQIDDSILALALSPDRKKLAAAGCDKMVRVWDLSAGYAQAKLEQTFQNHSDWIRGLAFSPDGKYLASGSRDKTAKVWDLAARKTLLTFADHQKPLYGVVLTANGPMGISVGEDGQVRLWDQQLGKQTKILEGHTKKIFSLAYYAGGKNPLLATGSADKTVRLWNPVTGAALATLAGYSDWVSALAFNADGSLLAGASWNGEVRVWKTSDGNLVKAGQC